MINGTLRSRTAKKLASAIKDIRDSARDAYFSNDDEIEAIGVDLISSLDDVEEALNHCGLDALVGAFELCVELNLNPNISAYSEAELASIRDALTKAGVL